MSKSILAGLTLLAGLSVWADPPAQHWSGTNLVDGATVEFPAVLEGRPAILIFWATWCPYCKAFMPYAGEIRADYAAHGVKIIAPNIKQGRKADPKAYIERLGFPVTAIADADAVAELYGVNFTPGLIVVDGEGVEVYRRKSTELPPGKKVAEHWADEVRRALDELVAGSTR